MDYLADITVYPHKKRSPFIFLERGHLRAEDHCLLLARETDEVEIPVARFSTIVLEPGVTVTHEAVKLAAEQGALLIWSGEAGVRVYSAGMPGGRSAERLLLQARVHQDDGLRLAAAKRLYRLMFDEEMPQTRSIERLRGFEGARVKALYRQLAEAAGIAWQGRDRAPAPLRDALGFATSCLYGVSEAVILATGYSPAIGIVHSGDARSLVFDLADTIKFKTVVPAAFDVYRESSNDVAGRVRRRCRDLFREIGATEILFSNLATIIEGDVDSPAAH